MRLPSRREFLQSGAVAGSGLLAGCPAQVSRPDCSGDELIHEADAPLGDGASWPTYQYDGANTGHSPNASGPKTDVELAWRYPACAEAGSGAVVRGGNAYAGGLVLDGRTGQRRGGTLEGNTPAVAGDRLYVARGAGLRARDASSGEVLWSLVGGSTSPTVVDGTVYVPEDEGEPGVYAADADAEEVLWRSGTSDDVDTTPAVVDGTVYVTDVADTVYAFDAADGAERWRRSPGPEVRRASPVVADGTLFFGSRDGTVLALDAADGADLWAEDVGFEVFGSVAVANGSVYATGGGGSIAALDAVEGSETWRQSTDDDTLSVPAVADGVVYVGADQSDGGAPIYAFDAADGTELWRYDTREVVFTDYLRSGVNPGLAVVDDVLYAATETGDVYALVEA